MVLITENNFEKARKLIRSSKKPIIFSSNNDALNTKILEKEKIDILLINLSNRKDFQKQRNSGFNQVMANLCSKKNTSLGINLDEIIESESIEKSKILARLRQNIMLCNKKKLNMVFVVQNKKNQRNLNNLKSLGLVLGMPTWMTKKLKIIVAS